MMSSICSSSSEANASEVLEHIEKMFPRHLCIDHEQMNFSSPPPRL